MSRSNSFLFDAGFFTSKQAAIIEQGCGRDGLLSYIQILCLLRSEESHSLPYDIKIISKLTRSSKKIIEKLLKVCLEKNYFFEKDSEIFSEIILKDLEKIENYKKSAVKREQEKRNKSIDLIEINKISTPIKEDNSEQNSARITSKVKISKDKEKDINFRKDCKENLLTAEDLEQLEIPSQWNPLLIRDKLKTWLEYKNTEKREPYKSLAPVKAILTQLQKSKPDTDQVLFAFDYAMSKGWHGVVMYPEVITAYNVSTQPTKEISTIEQYRLTHNLMD